MQYQRGPACFLASKTQGTLWPKKRDAIPEQPPQNLGHQNAEHPSLSLPTKIFLIEASRLSRGARHKEPRHKKAELKADFSSKSKETGQAPVKDDGSHGSAIVSTAGE